MIIARKLFASVLLASIVTTFLVAQSQAALVAYYPLDGNLNDVSGNGYNGIEQNGPFSYVASPYGQAVDLNGTSHWARLTSGANLGLGGNFTVATFINTDNLTGDHTILGNDGGNTNDTLHLVTRNATAHLGFYANDQPGVATLSTGTWTHVAYQFNNGVQSIFVNGTLDGTGGGHAAFAGAAKTVNLGSWGGGGGSNLFDGRIDNLAIYNTALAPSQIQYLAGGGNPQTLPTPPPQVTFNFGATPNLQGWTVQSGGAFFRPDEGGGITAANSIGGFAHDPAHTNFLVTSPTVYFNSAPFTGNSVITADFRGGMGDQNGSVASYVNPASVTGYNGGTTNNLGVKALGIFDVNAGVYRAFLLDPGDADGNGTVVGLSAAQLQSAGIVLNQMKPYRLDFFDTDDGGWGWTQLNSVNFSGSLTPVPEPATATLALIGLTALLIRRRRRA